MTPDSDLTGKILIAMPDMGDPRFRRSVVLVCAHSDDGAMGIVLNQPMKNMQFTKLLDLLGIEDVDHAPDLPVRTGGPVEPVRGFVLHRVPRDIQIADNQMRVSDDLAISTTRDFLVDYAHGRGPQPAVLALGYAGWGPGQLDSEILDNGWLTSERGDELIFGSDDNSKWRAALGALGIDPLRLSPDAGHA